MAKKKIRILAASDLHSDANLAKKLAERAKKEEVDLVILCGDLTFAETNTKGIISPFVNAKKQVLLVPGNHETVATADFLAELYGVTNLHGYSVKVGDIGVFGCGGANIGPHEVSEKDISYLLKKSFNRIKNVRKKIMVTHVHPEGTLIGKLTTVFPGSEAVTKAIKKFKPDIAICGHVHEAEGIEERLKETKVMNVGRKGIIFEV